MADNFWDCVDPANPPKMVPPYQRGSEAEQAYIKSEAERRSRHCRIRAAVPYDRAGCKQSVREAMAEVWCASLQKDLHRLFDRCCHT